MMGRSAGAEPPETVVLVHGVWMNGVVLLPLAWRLRRRGYRCLRFSYPSLRRGLTEIAELLHARLLGLGAQKVHLVGHSMGGLVIQRLLAEHELVMAGRVVALGTPFRGSWTARRIDRNRLLHLLLGRNRDALVGGTGPWPGARPLGVIAGTAPFGLGRLLGRMPGAGDGTVLVEETDVEGAADRCEIATTHTGLLFSAAAAAAVHAFLRSGRFAPGGAVSPLP